MLRPVGGTAVQTGFPAGLSHRTARYSLLRKPSVVFALRASLRLFKFVPNDKCVAKRQICLEQIWSPVGRPQGLRQERRKTACPRKGRPTAATCFAAHSCCACKPWANLPWFTRSPFGSPLALLACRAGSAKGPSFALCRRIASLRSPAGPIRPSSCDAQRG